MLSHPWTELQLLIKEKWLTQKAFASILWKKVSEVNELLKWKRNITIQRDYLLHQTLWTPIKYWILKQVDYDYSLLDIEESSNSHLPSEEKQSEIYSHQASHSEQSEESRKTWNQMDSLVDSLPQNNNTTQKENKPQETPIQEQKNENNEDFKKRANIFRTF